MSKQSAEEYLDELLNSVNRKEKHNELVDLDEDFVREVKGRISAGTAEEFGTAGTYRKPNPSVDNREIRMSPKAEAEFLMEFEQELEGEDFEDFLADFENNEIQPEDRLEAADMAFAEDEIQMQVGEPVEEPIEEVVEEPQISEPITGEKEEISLEELALNGLLAEEVTMDEPDLSADSSVPVADSMTAGIGNNGEEIDLSQMGDEDLISLLAGAEDLSDIGTLLSKNDEQVPVESEDTFAAFAANEMAGQEDISEANEQEKTKGKKGGFFDKLAGLLFGRDEEEQEEPVSLGTIEAPGAEQLSDENAEILAAFASADKANAAKKEKKKKEPKAKKPAKPKAPKKPKEKKPKEKKPKEVDNTPPLPKGPVALVCLLAVSIFILVFFGTELVSYSSAISKANNLYKMGQYAEAAEQLSGLKIKEDDTMFYGKIATLAAVDSQLSSYRVFLKNDRKAEALDSIICAAGRCEVNDDNTLLFDCAGEMEVLKNAIIVELKAQYDMTYEEAVELYQLTERDRDEYTIALDKIMKNLGIIPE